jgi:hypothetical protein
MQSPPHKIDSHSQNCSVWPLSILAFWLIQILMNCMSFGSFQIIYSLLMTHYSAPEIHSWKTHSINLRVHFTQYSYLPSPHVFAVSYGFCLKIFVLNLVNSDFHYCMKIFLFLLTVDVHNHWDPLLDLDSMKNWKNIIVDGRLKSGLD